MQLKLPYVKMAYVRMWTRAYWSPRSVNIIAASFSVKERRLQQDEETSDTLAMLRTELLSLDIAGHHIVSLGSLQNDFCESVCLDFAY